MTHRLLSALGLSAVCLAAALSLHTPAMAQAPAAPAPLPTSPAKKELVTKLLALQQPGIEAIARNLAEQPVTVLVQQASQVLRTRIAADKREALGAAINADVKKYVDETVPMVRDRAVKLAPTTVGTLMEERFTEDELKQIIAILESPVFSKYNRLQGEMQNALITKLVAETRPIVEPRFRALDLAVAKRLGIEPPAGAASGARTPAKPASN